MNRTDPPLRVLQQRTAEAFLARLETRILEYVQVESPIESMMLWALILVAIEDGFGLEVLADYGRVLAMEPTSVPAVLFLSTQHPVGEPPGRYRVDIAAHVEDEETGTRATLFIECDGHDYHERTKEQAMRDRKRDRYFQTSDLPLLRFTGTEIHKDAPGCARQAVEEVERLMNLRRE